MTELASTSAAYDGLNAISHAIQVQPSLVLSFYPYGIIMRRTVQGGGFTEYAVSAAQLATVLAARVQFETGFLTGNTLYVGTEGMRKVVAEYREPQRTALYLEAAETALVVPL